MKLKVLACSLFVVSQIASARPADVVRHLQCDGATNAQSMGLDIQGRTVSRAALVNNFEVLQTLTCSIYEDPSISEIEISCLGHINGVVNMPAIITVNLKDRAGIASYRKIDSASGTLGRSLDLNCTLN